MPHRSGPDAELTRERIALPTGIIVSKGDAIVRIEAFADTHLAQLLQLVNLHLTAAIPGRALSETTLARHLEHDATQPITDPWVAERTILCAVEGYRILAAAHLLRYGDQPAVREWCRGTAEIGWFLARPERPEAAAAILSAVDDQFRGWHVREVRGWGPGLPAGPLWGVPDVWPHIADALVAAGYRPDPATHREALYGGWLATVPPPEILPADGLTIRRTVGTYETRFTAILGGQEVGHCDIQPDLTHGGLSPALRGWGWLTDFQVHEDWRNRGIGSWLVRHAAAWLRLAGRDRVVLAVADQNEAAGAGRFYQRFGWEVFTREIHGWVRAASR